MSHDGADLAASGAQRIVCLTEVTTEWLYLLGQEHRIKMDWGLRHG